jgi:arginine decarboxylase
MPGHKLGSGIPEEFLSQLEKLDLTEIPGLDDLHNPSGVVCEAQELAAGAFGAEKSYFLVNGSTVGLHAAISAVCRPGQRLIAGRDSHSAVINGMLLAGVRPYYFMPEYSDSFGICTGITPREVERALSENTDAEAVLITRPNYYGVCCDIEEIAKIVHSRNKILIVDEAHGPHLVFNKRLPMCALEAGADICIQSAHKTLPAFTQGAYLHMAQTGWISGGLNTFWTCTRLPALLT